MKIDEIKLLAGKLRENISRVIIGKDETIDLVLISLLCSGHVLLEDVPGVGKTMLAKCLARSMDCAYKRVQFTPDLLPSDVTGVNYFDQRVGEFKFRPGPVFSNVILADEINRATPRTQSSLLECMEERQVTIDGETKNLSRPFFVIATQNPVEIQGTFPLPEAQLDRFFMRLRIGYPSFEQGLEVLDRFREGNPLGEIGYVATASEIIDAQDSLAPVRINDAIKNYIMKIVERTRKHDRISLGISPRGSIALMKASQANAVLNGRDFVTPDDIKHTAVPVLAHRLMLKGHSISRSATEAESVVSHILGEIPVPTEEL